MMMSRSSTSNAYHQALIDVLKRPNMERTGNMPVSRALYDLQAMNELMGRLGDPQVSVPTIHIAGTKGKGSVAAMMESILAAAGNMVGLYTSPHLHSFRERIRINQEPLDELDFSRAVQALLPTIDALEQDDRFPQITTFEMLTAMAFLTFEQSACRFGVIEVGLGGRLDATNVIPRPLVSIITPISLDHTAILGSTVERIATDKTHIIKPETRVVSAPQMPEALAVIRGAAAGKNASVVYVDDLYAWDRMTSNLDGQSFRIDRPGGAFEGWIPLLGAHQLENVATSLAACDVLREQGVHLPDEAIERGLRKIRWPGRLEILSRSPVVAVDGAHNTHSAARLRAAVQEYLPHRRLILIFGVSSDKDLRGITRELAPITSEVFACRSQHPRSRRVEDIAGEFASLGVAVRDFPTVGQATSAALKVAQTEDVVVGTGSFFLVAEMREVVLGISPEVYPHLEF